MSFWSLLVVLFQLLFSLLLILIDSQFLNYHNKVPNKGILVNAFGAYQCEYWLEVQTDGIAVIPAKVEAVLQWERSKTVRGVRIFWAFHRAFLDVLLTKSGFLKGQILFV